MWGGGMYAACTHTNGYLAILADPKYVTLNDPEWLFYVKFYFAPVFL